MNVLVTGAECDKPESVVRIPSLIEAYNINIKEIELPVNQYRTLNEFFYRRLREGARPVFAKEYPFYACQPCDCRLMVFENMRMAQRLWVKGNGRLLAAQLHRPIRRLYACNSILYGL